MMKKSIVVFLIAVMLTMVACGKKTEKTPAQPEASSVESPAAESKENTEAKTEPAVESVVSETTETPDEKAESDSIKWDYTVLEDGTISLYGYETDQIPEVMEVPSTVDGKTVTEIDSLFLNEENVKKVILPSTINSIGPNAFRGSVSIEEVEINSIIEIIHAKAFYECSGIKSLMFPDGLKKIDETGIFLNSGLKELHVPASVEMSADDLSYAVFLTEDTTIYAPAGSVWEKYANEIGYQCFGPLSEDAICKLESALGVTLPGNYREFLKETGGGIVKQDGNNRIMVTSIGQTIAVDVFFGYGVTQNSDILYWNEKYKDEMLDGAVLIGFDVHQGFLFLIADGRDDTGVYYWDDSYVFEESDDDQNVYLLVKNLSELAVSKS